MLEFGIDIETGSTSREHLPAVWEIGAVLFDRSRPADDCVVDEFQFRISAAQASHHGHFDADTRRWLDDNRPDWDQDPALSDIRAGRAGTPCMAISQLYEFARRYGGADRHTPTRWWAWGAEFDLRIVMGLIERLRRPAFPIHYRDVRDARTYCTELADQFGIQLPKQDPATKHNALDDARHCARLVTGVTQSMEVIREMAESREVVA